MGIRNIGFSSVTNNTPSRADEEIWATSDRDGLYLVWTTDSGTGTHKSFTITISFSGIPKGLTTQTAQSKIYTKTLNISECNEHTSQYASGVFWAVGLSKFDDLVSKLGSYTNDDIDYANRSYDYLKFDVSIIANYADDFEWAQGQTSSPPEYANLTVSYIPDYVISDVYYDEPELIVIEYTAEGWTRFDDRWALHNAKVSDGTSTMLKSESIIAQNTWGTVTKYGRIECPASAFTESLMGKDIRLMVRFVASYQPIGGAGNTDTWEDTVTSKILKNTPTLSLASNDGSSIAFNVGDSGDKDAEIDTVTVTMEDGRYTVDTVTVVKEGSSFPQAVFRFCPYNKDLSFTAIGTKGKGASNPKTVSGVKLKNRNKTSFDVIDGTGHVDLYQDIETSISTANNHDLVQFKGRRRPSAFYGEGGTTSLSFSASMLYEDADDFMALAQAELGDTGDIMVRLPDGRRYAMAVDSCDVDWTLRNQKQVSISGEEVDA